MLRVIKSTNLNLGYEPEPVAIDNTVVIKQKEIPAETESEGDNIFREFVAEDVTDVVFQLRDEDDVSSTGHPGVQGYPSGLMSHYFNNKYSSM